MFTKNSYQKIKTTYKNITLKGEPAVYINETAWNKIQFLCEKINTVEWSGVMFYKFLSDNPTLSDSSTLDVEVIDIIPLDKGTTGFTSYTFDARVLKYMTEMDYFELKTGHLHSHHSMKTFFSGTDMEELNENSEFIKPYLSLIVNNREEFSCKLAFRVEHAPITYSYTDIDGEFKFMDIKTENEVIVASYDCIIHRPVKEWNLNQSFFNQYKEIIAPKPVPTFKSNPNPDYKLPVKEYKQEDVFDWIDSITDTSTLMFDTQEPDDSPTLRELEEMSCCILRLGLEIINDTLENTLEDLENSIMQDDFNFEEYCTKVSDNISDYIKSYWNAPEMSEESVSVFVLDFLDELLFAQDEFPFVEQIILEFENKKI